VDIILKSFDDSSVYFTANPLFFIVVYDITHFFVIESCIHSKRSTRSRKKSAKDNNAMNDIKRQQIANKNMHTCYI